MKKTGGKATEGKKIRMQGRKDWVIFWVFAALVCYCLAHPIEYQVNAWLRERGNPWLKEINEPQPYGRMIAAVLLFILVAEVVLFLCRKSLKAKLALLAAGVLMPLSLMGIYQANCQLVTSVLWREAPRMAVITYREGEERISVPLSSEECQEIQELARNMTVVSDEAEKEKFMEWFTTETSDAYLGADQVSLYFPEKYGHSYSLDIRCKDGYVYLWRGHGRTQADLVTLFQDNGVARWMEEMRQQAHPQGVTRQD